MVAASVQQGLSSWWAPGLAFLAGIVSCASPCVWPLLPGYISFVTGEVSVDADDPHPLAPILLFILGFTIVFALLGAFSSTLVRLLRGTTGQRVGGIVVIALGLFMIGYALQRGSLSLYGERRPFLARVRPGTVGAVPLGMAFAAGWTPCIGPVLGGILAIAGNGSVARGMFLLVCYSLGLGLPFLLVGLGIRKFMGAFGWIRRNYRPIAAVSGSFLVLVGVLMFTGRFTEVFNRLSSHIPVL
jgi:cytochrome c-type biogenesis protein